MNARERFGELIDIQRSRLRVTIPPDREGAILALLRVQDRLSGDPETTPVPDLITGQRLPNPAGNEALRLCIEAIGIDVAPAASRDGLDAWANRFLQECERIVNAELVLAHCDTGFMRLVDQPDGSLAAWIASKQVPASWRERADFTWWASSLARRHQQAVSDLRAETHDPADDTRYRNLARLHLDMMAHQLGYPPGGVIGEHTIRMWLDILGHLVARALRERDLGHAGAPQSETALIAGIAPEVAAGWRRSSAGKTNSRRPISTRSSTSHARCPRRKSSTSSVPPSRLATPRSTASAVTSAGTTTSWHGSRTAFSRSPMRSAHSIPSTPRG